MGYRSQVVFKTTTEGYLVFKRFDDSIKDLDSKPLSGAEIYKTSSGFYKIVFDDVKWYDSYTSVEKFYDGMARLEEQDIPYKFIRLGEDIEDIEVKENYTDDMPDELCEFNPEVSIYDANDGDYEIIESPGED